MVVSGYRQPIAHFPFFALGGGHPAIMPLFPQALLQKAAARTRHVCPPLLIPSRSLSFLPSLFSLLSLRNRQNPACSLLYFFVFFGSASVAISPLWAHNRGPAQPTTFPAWLKRGMQFNSALSARKIRVTPSLLQTPTGFLFFPFHSISTPLCLLSPLSSLKYYLLTSTLQVIW